LTPTSLRYAAAGEKGPAGVAGTAALWLWRTRRRRVSSLDQLLSHGLVDLYRTETQLVPVLDRMARQARNEELAQAFTQHRVETEDTSIGSIVSSNQSASSPPAVHRRPSRRWSPKGSGSWRVT
jgi:hypothetical protein